MQQYLENQLSSRIQRARELGWSDDEIQRSAAMERAKMPVAQQKPEVGGLQKLLIDALPMLGSAAGAVGGSFLGGPVGTVGGGAAGGGFGEFLAQQLRGEDTDLGAVVREGALGAVPGGLGLAAKGVRAAKGSLAGAKVTDTATDTAKMVDPAAPTPTRMPVNNLTSYEGAPDAARVGQYKQMIQSGQKVDPLKVTPDSTGAMGIEDGKHRFEAFKQLGFKDVPVETVKPGLVSRARQGAADTSQEGFGLTVGQSKGGGRVLNPDDASRVQEFITTGARKYGGIRPGKPIDQARDAQNVLNNVTKSLDDTLSTINRNVDPAEVATIGQNITQRIANNAMIGRTAPTANKLTQKIQSATDLKSLEAIRREADNVAFTATGAGKTAKAAQAKEVRDAIDEFITPLSPEYKAVKGDYVLARDALEATAKANKSAKGFKIPFVDVEVGKQSISGIKNKAAAKIAGQPGAEPKTGGFRPFLKPTIQQAATRGVAAGFGVGGAPQEPLEATSQGLPPEMGQAPQMAPQQPSQSQQLFESALKYAQETGDLKGAQQMAALAQQAADMEKLSGGGQGKPLSAESSKLVANAESGLTSLQQLQSMLQQDPSIQGKSAVSSTFDPFGATSAALGTSSYENAKNNIADVITRLRTGAALTESEEAFYKKQLPQPFDPPETVQQKLAMFSDLFQRVAGTGRSTSDVDPSQALAGAF